MEEIMQINIFNNFLILQKMIINNKFKREDAIANNQDVSNFIVNVTQTVSIVKGVFV